MLSVAHRLAGADINILLSLIKSLNDRSVIAYTVGGRRLDKFMALGAALERIGRVRLHLFTKLEQFQAMRAIKVIVRGFRMLSLILTPTLGEEAL